MSSILYNEDKWCVLSSWGFTGTASHRSRQRWEEQRSVGAFVGGDTGFLLPAVS